MNMDRVVSLWLQQAEHERQVAEQTAAGGAFDVAVRLLQESVEKYVKALYVRRKGGEPPRTHALVDLGLKLGAPTPILEALGKVSENYMKARYPDMEEHAPFLAFGGREFATLKISADQAIQWALEELRKG